MKSGVPDIAQKGAEFVSKQMQSVYGMQLDPDEISDIADKIYIVCNAKRVAAAMKARTDSAILEAK